MSFAKHLGLPSSSGEGVENKRIVSAPFAWLMQMHSMILGGSDAGKSGGYMQIGTQGSKRRISLSLIKLDKTAKLTKSLSPQQPESARSSC